MNVLLWHLHTEYLTRTVFSFTFLGWCKKGLLITQTKRTLQVIALFIIILPEWNKHANTYWHWMMSGVKSRWLFGLITLTDSGDIMQERAWSSGLHLLSDSWGMTKHLSVSGPKLKALIIHPARVNWQTISSQRQLQNIQWRLLMRLAFL